MTKKVSKKLVSKSNKKKPLIIVQDIKLKKKYYRVTGVKFKKEKYKRKDKEWTDKFYIYWNDSDGFQKGLNTLLRHYEYNRIDIKDITGTTTHKYLKTTFIDRGFKP
jgi:hypothetical protein